MKTSKTTSIIAATTALAFATPSPADAKPLREGSHGVAVKRLQRALGLKADGLFGPGTARALVRFQRRHLLPADGIAGSATRDMIRRSRAARQRRSGHGARVAKAGGATRVKTRGPSVRLAQRRLGVEADGVFGPGTARAVKRLQRRHGLEADGIVGPATWKALGIRGRHPVLKRAHLKRGSSRRPSRSARPSAIARAIAAGDRIATAPYRYGGGHGSFTDSGYDCSGSVSYVLHAIGRLGVPRDSSGFMSYGDAGPGRWITIYANPGHAYMTIGGRRFDTSAPGNTRWTNQPRPAAGYTVRHPPGL